MVYLSFIYYYFGPVCFATYLAGLVLFKDKQSVVDIFFLFFVLFLFAFHFYHHSFYFILYKARFFFGFLSFYFYFKNYTINIKRLLIFLVFLTLFEAVAINTIVDASTLPNFPEKEKAMSHFAIVGHYQRPYSFAGNASVGSALIVALLSMSKVPTLIYISSIFTVFVFASGTGFLSLTLYFILNSWNFIRGHFIRFVLLLLIVALGLYYIGQSEYFSGSLVKISYKYYDYLIKFKLLQINEAIFNRFSIFDYLLGYTGATAIDDPAGDFGMLSYFFYYGVAGIIITGLIIIRNLNKSNYKTVIILLVSSVHYPVIFFLPGQVIFAYALNYKKSLIK